MESQQILAAFSGAGGLPCYDVAQGENLVLRLANLTGQDIVIAAGAKIEVDLGESGPVNSEAPTLNHGFRALPWSNGLLVLEANWPSLLWQPGQQLAFDLGRPTDWSSSGFLTAGITLTGMGTPSPQELRIPLLCFQSTANDARTLTRIPASAPLASYDVEPVGGTESADAVTLTLGGDLRGQEPAADGAGRAYVVPFLFDAPGRSAVSSLDSVADMEITCPDGDCNRLDLTVPAWRIDFPKGPPAAIELKVEGLSRRMAPGRGDFAVMSTTDDRVMDLLALASVKRDAAPLAASLTVEDAGKNVSQITLTRTLQPQQVFLDWTTTGAAAVTLTSLAGYRPAPKGYFGVVSSSGSKAAYMVESSSDFVLTAYGPGFQEILTSTVTVTMSPDITEGLVPSKTIMPWSGPADATQVPEGWAFCNGDSGTPDLQDRFVLGANEKTAGVDTSGGDTHTHSFTSIPLNSSLASAGDHSHNFPSNWKGVTVVSPNTFIPDRHIVDTGSTANYSSDTTTDNGSHTDSIADTIDTVLTGNNDKPVMPPWYALCYIMKV